jgi:hypothetical protein
MGSQQLTFSSLAYFVGLPLSEIMTKPLETTVACIKHDGVVATIKYTCSSFSFKDGNIHLGEFSGVFSFNPEPETVENKKEDAGKDDGSKESSKNLLELDDDEGSDSDGSKELSKNLGKCTLEVYSDKDFEEDKFLSQ